MNEEGGEEELAGIQPAPEHEKVIGMGWMYGEGGGMCVQVSIWPPSERCFHHAGLSANVKTVDESDQKEQAGREGGKLGRGRISGRRGRNPAIYCKVGRMEEG